MQISNPRLNVKDLTRQTPTNESGMVGGSNDIGGAVAVSKVATSALTAAGKSAAKTGFFSTIGKWFLGIGGGIASFFAGTANTLKWSGKMIPALIIGSISQSALERILPSSIEGATGASTQIAGHYTIRSLNWPLKYKLFLHALLAALGLFTFTKYIKGIVYANNKFYVSNDSGTDLAEASEEDLSVYLANSMQEAGKNPYSFMNIIQLSDELVTGGYLTEEEISAITIISVNSESLPSDELKLFLSAIKKLRARSTSNPLDVNNKLLSMIPLDAILHTQFLY